MNKQAYNAQMIKCSQSWKLSRMGIWSIIHFTKALKSKENHIILSCIFCLDLFGCWVRRLKVTKPFIHVIYGLAAVPARWFFWGSDGMLTPKACHTDFYDISHLLDGNSSNPGYLRGSLSSNWATHQLSLSTLPYRLHQSGGVY